MRKLADRVARAVGAVCPIDGVSLGNRFVDGETVITDPADRRTWRIDFKAEATTLQREAAEAVVASFDVEKDEAIAAIDAQLEEIDALTMKGVRGLREFILAQAQLTDHLITNGTVPVPGQPVSGNVGIVKVLELEQQAVALRVQRKALTG